VRSAVKWSVSWAMDVRWEVAFGRCVSATAVRGAESYAARRF